MAKVVVVEVVDGEAEEVSYFLGFRSRFSRLRSDFDLPRPMLSLTSNSSFSFLLVTSESFLVSVMLLGLDFKGL